MEPTKMIYPSDTIAAISTPPGMGGISVIRISGPEAIRIVNNAWKGADLSKVPSHTVHLGKYLNKDGEIIDEAVATLFISPASFTGEDVVELSVHGSTWIQQALLHDLVVRGARIANPGEFTQRAFLNGKIDLAQAEGVADLIASSSKAAHDIAINQTKGTFSKEFNRLRDKLIEFASLLELELDFSEEDVEFADRTRLITLCEEVLSKVDSLSQSYAHGNALKNGVPIVIAGVPNAGKSSLLNLLLGDDKAIVTDLPGTTRDIIEDTIEIKGILYRFIDTAGLRETSDKVEAIGVDRAVDALNRAFAVIWLLDPLQPLTDQIEPLSSFKESHPSTPILLLINKADLCAASNKESFQEFSNREVLDGLTVINFSTKTSEGMPVLLSALKELATADRNPEKDIIITNARHYEALSRASQSLKSALSALNSGLSADFVAQEIREAISFLSALTGSITSSDLLASIFSRFCIGK